MQWNTCYMIPFILTFKNKQLIDVDESQISGYHWGEEICGNLWRPISWFDTFCENSSMSYAFFCMYVHINKKFT